MKPSIHSKLENLSERLEEINALLADPNVIGDQDRFRSLSREHSQISPVVDCFHKYQTTIKDMEAASLMLKDEDKEMRSMAEDELQNARERQQKLDLELQKLLLPKDPNDSRNIFLEIRAGTGGDEAALFVGD